MPGFQQRFNGQRFQHPNMVYRQPHHHYQQVEDPDPNGEQFRKLFIGGLSFESDEDSLRKYFSKYGEIVDCVVMRDQTTKQSRGFGFITYKDKDSVDEVQRDRKEKKHFLDSREIETKRAMPRDDPNAGNQATVNKMFLGGLKDDTTEEMIRSVFSQYGKVKEVELITDKNTGKIKGFCFVTFDDYDPVDKCVLMRRIQLNSKKVEAKKAFAKSEMERLNHRMGNMSMNMGMGGMGPGPMQMGRGGHGDFPGGMNRDYGRDYYGGGCYHGGHGSGMGNNYGGYGGGWQKPMYDSFYHGNPRGGYGGSGRYNNK